MSDKPSLDEKRARLQRALDIMRVEFERGLPARIEALRAALASFHLDGARYQPAEVAAHSLCGIAGSFGRPALTEAAARLEELLIGALGTPPEQWPALSERLARALAEVEAVAASAAPPASTAP